jgi:hypothetical protein
MSIKVIIMKPAASARKPVLISIFPEIPIIRMLIRMPRIVVTVITDNIVVYFAHKKLPRETGFESASDKVWSSFSPEIVSNANNKARKLMQTDTIKDQLRL